MIHADIFISTPQPGFRSYLYLHATSWFMLVFVFTHHNLVHACICIYIHATTGHNRPQPGSWLYSYATICFTLVFVNSNHYKNTQDLAPVIIRIRHNPYDLDSTVYTLPSNQSIVKTMAHVPLYTVRQVLADFTVCDAIAKLYVT